MQGEKIIDCFERVNNIVAQNDDILDAEASSLRVEHSITSAQSIQEAIESKENANRLLQIGIVGRVKSGKSSLLNALLFDGQLVLPKAATPMTAALTVLSYGEKLSCEVEFFSQQDIDNIKGKHDKYNLSLKKEYDKKLDELTQKKKAKGQNLTSDEVQEIKDKAIRSAKRGIEDLELKACSEQYEMILDSGIKMGSLGEKKRLEANDLKSLSNCLSEYVGADGRFMPFTKCVHVKLPLENLKDIQVADTPGLNDPVQSRESRTRELLAHCDVIFIVSPSGQFISSDDTALMDRITTKEGVREIFVVSSQVDNQLMGNEKAKANGELPKVLSGITRTLGMHLRETLAQLKKNNPEIRDAFDHLINGEDKVVHSSGIAQTIKHFFDQKGKLDEGAAKVWENLTREYPHYFNDQNRETSIANLDFLSNMDRIKTIIDQVKSNKTKILEAAKDDFIQAKLNALTEYKKGLIDYAQRQSLKIQDGSIENIKKQKQNLAKVKKNASSAIDEAYLNLIGDLTAEAQKDMLKIVDSHYGQLSKSANDASGTETQSYREKKSGFLAGCARFFGVGGYETRYEEVSTVRTGAVHSALKDFTYRIENGITGVTDSLKPEWRKKLSSVVLKTLRENVSDDDLDVHLIRDAIRDILNAVEYPEISFSEGMSANLAPCGLLKGYDAETYLENANQYGQGLRNRITKDIRTFFQNLSRKLENNQPSSKIFENYNHRMEELEQQITNKEVIMARFAKLIKELEVI
jgi:hypothetical protein